MEQQKLFKLAPEAAVIQCHYRPGYGWSVVVRMRRQGEAWQDAYQVVHECLSTPELLDVCCGELSTALGL